ncbi:MAG TPA: glycosyltransferase [Streptosporangiaceae bacterium]|nr:glycosyltransferase [Streptosporangiaceae bacterium]
MKIALIADELCVPSPADVYPGSPERRVLPLASALAGHDHEVTVYSRRQSAARGHAAADRPGVDIELLDAGPRRPLPGELLLPHIAVLADRLADRWRRDAPDVVHAQSWTGGVAAVAGARGLGIPLVVTLAPSGGDGRGRQAADAGARDRMEASLTRSVQAVLADSSREGTRLSRLAASRGAAPSASVRVVPPGVDTQTFCPDGPAAARGERPRLLVVAPPGDEPDLATVVHALAELPNAELVVAGGPARGRLRRDPGYRAIIGLARQLGVADRLTCTGAVREADMPALMRSADVLVHLTQDRGLAMVAVEAMACGTPVMAAEDSAQPDAVIHENTGFLVPPGSPAQLVRRTRQLLANPMLLDGYAIAAARRAADRFSWDRIARETLAVYTALLGPRIPALA